tara:strand:+ start:303 stop:518 length:216 start_codon:yes stop_codon:yes gene_type:complete
MLRASGIPQRMVIRNLNISLRKAIRKSGGCVNGSMNGKQRLATGQREVAARSVLGGNNQIQTRLFELIKMY